MSFTVARRPGPRHIRAADQLRRQLLPVLPGQLRHAALSLAFLSGNLFAYTPDAGFVGTDSFTVVATDGQGNSNVATITITVTPPAQSITLTEARNIVSYAGNDRAVLVAALGGDDRVTGTAYNDTLDGGDGHDQLFGGAGADHIFGGAGTDWLQGGAGYDELVGGAGTDGIRGEAGDDLLDGGADSDDVRGGDGEDVINGGAGRDRLAGGAGRDAFIFNAALGLANDDSVEDFRTIDDVFRLDGSASRAFSSGPLTLAVFVTGTQALDASDRIIYNQASGELSFDVDGAGGAAAVKFAGPCQHDAHGGRLHRGLSCGIRSRSSCSFPRAARRAAAHTTTKSAIGDDRSSGSGRRRMAAYIAHPCRPANAPEVCRGTQRLFLPLGKRIAERACSAVSGNAVTR